MEIINRYGTLGYHGVCTSKLIDDVRNILVILRLRVTSRGSKKIITLFLHLIGNACCFFYTGMATKM